MKNKWLFITALSGFLAVALGAFAAHSLQKTLSPQALAWIDTGLKYQVFHTLALMVLGVLQVVVNNSERTLKINATLNIIGTFWLLGMLLFSGSLYALAFGVEKSVIWWITPVGGTLFLIGWLVLAYKAIK
ncbi:uncharacterized membrane protein YgdD (TMEM256/DUF423 family) [Bisgaardia hudsonensis]|uniref:Uncharacterized membrane protein YgdD (TMEM256/DUF423 family) n=1 Tax=Bisgaardia hudsonensis TaxID=109472 RepID=A0A4R2N0X1_9PAST|nr:DUF423 domain-containing protein [Bisgaardia hudsonensis]QLB13233.1 hypothetical protein A6A11_06205 [Bisgaardia hudsonensis]TCP13187.1 uncharacterized membrane protein YgdD (TMEM256/DUF423 family) [Bisgaardia hudsonensis]